METNVFKRDDESAKAIRNEVELIILLYGYVIDYEYILNHFEISQKTFKRDMEGIRKALECLFRQFPARVLGNCRPLPKRAIANTCRRLEVPYFSFINLIK